MQHTRRSMSAFTLAEMMVVMLIISIVLAAMAPVMTTRNKIDNSSPWHWVTSSPSDAYFGAGQAMRAFIGQNEGTDNDSAKLVINTAGSQLSHILFKSNDNILGDLYMSKDGEHGSSIVLGNRRNPAATIGNENINIGWDNWPNANLTGASNITIGDTSMQSLTSGGHNIGLGTTLSAVTDGDHNIGIGDDSMLAITGSGNIGIGGNANATATNVSNTVAIGRNSVASADEAIAIGMVSQATGQNGVAIGQRATASNIAAIAIGLNAEANNADGSGVASVAIGRNTNANAQSAVAIGDGAEANAAENSGTSSVAIGRNTNANAQSAVAIGDGAEAPTTYGIAIGNAPRVNGNYGIAMGSQAETAESGVAIGSNANAAGTSGIAIGNNVRANIQDVAIGPEAVALSGTNGTTIAIGYQAMKNSKESGSSIAIGQEALYNNGNGSGSTPGWDNIGIGYRASMNNTTGSDNVAVGALALRDNVNGNKNTAIGEFACSNVQGSYKTCIGYNSGPGASSDWAKSTDDTERIFIGSKSNYNNGPAVLEVHNGIKDLEISRSRNLAKSVVVINGALLVKGGIITSMPRVDDRKFDGNGGVNMIGRTGGQLEPVNVNWDHTESQLSGEFDTEAHGRFKSPNSGDYYSDRRLKYVGKENTSGLDKIRQLKVFNYTFKKDTTKTPHVGVIAQDLQKVFPDAVKKGTDGFLRIRMEDMFYAVINAIKELDAKYQAQEKRINDLEKRVEKLEARAKQS